MGIRQCRRCDKLFHDMGKSICPICVTELDEMFTTVRDYLFDHRNASVEEVVENTGAEADDVIEWVREGRLVAGDAKQSFLKCERCGLSISQGRFCAACSAEMMSKLENTASQLRGRQPSSDADRYNGPRMRTERLGD